MSVTFVPPTSHMPADTPPRPDASNQRQSAPQDNEDHWAVLAGLRFVLALTVLVTHVSNFAPVPRLFHVFTAMGSGTAVLGFFLVSGYSIAHSIVRQERGFYERRFERIYPVYFACILLALVPLALGIRESRGDVWTYVGQFFFAQGFLTLPIATLMPSWSLSLEVGYYALSPFFKRLTDRGLLILFAVSALLYVFRQHFNAENLVGQTHGLSFVCLAWAWLLGFIAYRLKDRRVSAALIFGVGIALNQLYGHPIAPLGFLLSIVVGIAVLWIPRKPISPRLRKTLNFGGDVSYPLYLCHPPVVALALYCHRGASGVEVIGLCLASAAVVFFCVDLPFRKLFRARRAARSAVASA